MGSSRSVPGATMAVPWASPSGISLIVEFLNRSSSWDWDMEVRSCNVTAIGIKGWMVTERSRSWYVCEGQIGNPGGILDLFTGLLLCKRRMFPGRVSLRGAGEYQEGSWTSGSGAVRLAGAHREPGGILDLSVRANLRTANSDRA